jgi:hypothetical protein
VCSVGYREIRRSDKETHSSADDVPQGNGRRSMRRLSVLVGAALIAASMGALVMVGAAGASSKNYTAIALSRSTVLTTSADAVSKNQAANKAWSKCDSAASQDRPDLYNGDCEIALWVKNGWAAVAFEGTIEGPPYNPSWGAGYGHTRSEAQAAAKAGCEPGAQEPCTVDRTERTPYFDPSLPTSAGR